MKRFIFPSALLLLIAACALSLACDNTAKAVPSAASIYDGTYTGVFNYSYGSGSDTTRPYTPATMLVTLTLDSTLRPQTSPGNVILSVTNAIVDDSAFGTGTDGITPVDDPIDGGPSVATFPVDPSNTQKTGLILAAYLPIGDSTVASVVAAYGKEGDLTISSDGKTLSGTVWAAGAYQGIWSSWGNYF
jgi:hypothetical protein